MSLNLLQLSEFRAQNVFNPWGEDDPMDAYPGSVMRLTRLAQHFDCSPKYILVGEAPGYQGCHFSGVPFTNEKLLMEGKVPRVKVNMRITTRERPWSEPSATVMWGTLRDLRIADVTVMWNSYAFHPFKPGEPMSNRAPTETELSNGLPILRMVIDYFQGAHVIAVGKVAERTLKRLGITTAGSVRHPSMGGATAFREGMRRFSERAAA
jgi:hypothetical protein